MTNKVWMVGWFWVKATGMVLVTLSMTMCGGAEPPVEDVIVESSLVEPDVSTLTPEATDENIMQHSTSQILTVIVHTTSSVCGWSIESRQRRG